MRDSYDLRRSRHGDWSGREREKGDKGMEILLKMHFWNLTPPDYESNFVIFRSSLKTIKFK